MGRERYLSEDRHWFGRGVRWQESRSERVWPSELRTNQRLWLHVETQQLVIQPETCSVASVTGGSAPVTGGPVAEGPAGALASPGAGARRSLPPSRLRLSMLLLLMHRGKLGAGLEI